MAELEQQRILKTAIPGPRSLELMARKTGAVARGVGTTMPVFAVEAGGGVIVDADGNSLIDFGSGIAVTTIGNSALAWLPQFKIRWSCSPTPAS